MLSDFTAVFVVIVFTIVSFVSAYKNGVLKLLASGGAAALALAAFFSGVNYAPELVEKEMSATAVFGVSAGLAVLVYFVVLIGLSLVLKPMFGPDSFLHWMVDGIPGGLVSLFPSTVVAVFIFTCVRIAGTVQELNYTATLSQPGIEDLTRRIPKYPFSANWRNGIESLPAVAPALDSIDPFSNRLNRNTAALTMMHGSFRFVRYLEEQPETANLVNEEGFEKFRSYKNIRKALDKNDRLGLVMNPDLHDVARRTEHSGQLRKLDLKPILVGFGRTIQPDEPNLQ